MQKPANTVVGGREFRWGERTYVMGVINVTLDSFSGDGLGSDVAAAVALGLRFVQEGADILDVGGESTRPPHAARAESRFSAEARAGAIVDEEEELSRVLPVIEGLRKATEVPISIDTYKQGVAQRALDAGASLLNDVWGTFTETNVAPVAAERGAPVVLMHNQQGTKYSGDPVTEIIAELGRARDAALAAGAPRENIVLDPGFGFGKDAQANLEILRRLSEFQRLGQPLLVGASRKFTIGLVLNLPPDERVEGTAAAVTLAIAGGADIVRVHDVKQMARVSRMADAIVRGWRPAASL